MYKYLIALIVLLFSYTTSHAQVSLPINEEIEFYAGIKTYQVILPSATAQLIIKNATGLELARFTNAGGLVMQGTANVQIDSASQIKTSAGVDAATGAFSTGVQSASLTITSTGNIGGNFTNAGKTYKFAKVNIAAGTAVAALFSTDDSMIGDLDPDDMVIVVINSGTASVQSASPGFTSSGAGSLAVQLSGALNADASATVLSLQD